jgi:branched-chain amino acid aminotransferase
MGNYYRTVEWFFVHRYILHNDKIHEASESVLATGQVGLLSGWGVFSTLHVADGVLFAWERHWARMAKDAALLRVPLPDSDRARLRLLELVDANRAYNATLRVVVVRNSGSIWEGPPTGRASDLIALTADLKDWGAGVKLSYVEQARHAACMFAGTKILSWAMNLTWVEEAHERGFDEVILLNERGEVAECTSANIFIACGNQVLTPPLSSGCLPGVTRDLLLHEIRVPGIEIGERTLLPSDVEQADDVFITSTTRALLPVLEINGKKVGGRGSAQNILQGLFESYVAGYVSQAKSQTVA